MFLSGLVARRGTDGGPVVGDVAAQTRVVLDNARELLAAAGFTMADVVSARVFITAAGDFAPMNEVYRAAFRGAPPPSRATVVAALMAPGLEVEITFVAVRDPRRAVIGTVGALPFSPAVIAGGRVFVSGMLGNSAGARVDTATETREIVARVGRPARRGRQLVGRGARRPCLRHAPASRGRRARRARRRMPGRAAGGRRRPGRSRRARRHGGDHGDGVAGARTGMIGAGRRLALAAGVALAAGEAGPALAQRYATAAAAIAPVPMASSCAAAAAAQIDTGAAWLLVLEADQARAAFDRAADLDPDCALAYWGRALARANAAAEGSPAAIPTILADISRAASVPARTPFERAAVAALQRLAKREAAPGVPAAWPVRLAAYRDAICEAVPATIWCARALADTVARLPSGATPEVSPALARVVEIARTGPLDVGAAVIVLDVASDPRAPIVSRALAAIATAAPPAPAPHRLAARAAVRRGEWTAAVTSAERARAAASDAVPAGDLLDAQLEALLQLGRRTEAYALAGAALRLSADAPEAAHAAAARAFARVLLGDRRLDGRGLAERTALPLGERDAARWPVVFAAGLDDALRGWPGGDQARLRIARAAMTSLDELAAGDPRSEVAWARTIVEAAIAASQDEHPQMALLLAHAAELEAQLLADGRVHLSLVPTRELAAELWLRTYRYDDARREARALDAVVPRRISPAVVLARTATRLQDAAAADLWRAVLELRTTADANDSLRLEAQAALEALPRAR